MSNPVSYLETCARCNTAQRFTQPVGRFIPCPVCHADPGRVAERDAFMTEHPAGIFNLGSVEMKRVRGRSGKRVCDEACTSAKGAACQCEGRNHGSQWDAA